MTLRNDGDAKHVGKGHVADRVQRAGASHVATSSMIPNEAPVRRPMRHQVKPQGDVNANKDHLSNNFVPRPSARVRASVNVIGFRRRANPAIRSAFQESVPVDDQPAHRRPLRATPWALDMPSSRRQKVVPEVVHNPRRKFIKQQPETQAVELSKQAKKRLPHQYANLESTPVEPPPPRDPSKPVVAKYRSTPGLLRFSPRVSTLTPRKKVLTQRHNILSWVEAPPTAKAKPRPAPAPEGATMTSQGAVGGKASLDAPKARSKRHIDSAAGQTASKIFTGEELHQSHKKCFPSQSAETVKTAPAAGKARTVPSAAARSTTPWDSSYTRSPFDPGSARGWKPTANLPARRRYVDPNTQ